jgi:iron complex transport system substrate-binding protein
VTDSEGREVEITDTDRILPIDISGTIAATVFALGLGDQVVGRDASTQFPGTEDLPVVTKTGHTLNPEAILELAPTVVLTDTTISPKEVRQQLRDAGIAVVVISSDRRIDTTDALVTEIATALGVPTRGTALSARLDAELDAAIAEIADVTPSAETDRARMLFLYVRGSANVYYIFGEDSGADSLIDAVGGVDVAEEIGWEGMKPMTAEALVAAQPDVLVMMTDGLESVGGVDGLIERIPAIAETPAGAHRRVIDMADAEILSFGPRSADVISALARALYAPEPAS